MKYSEFYGGRDEHVWRRIPDDDVDDGFGSDGLAFGADAPFLEALQAFDPWERIRELEARIAMLAANNSQLKASLRAMMDLTKHASDHGTASWYRAAHIALNTRTDLDGD
jgi:hypothetical protein